MSLHAPFKRPLAVGLLLSLAGCHTPAAPEPVRGGLPVALAAAAAGTQIPLQGRTPAETTSKIFLLDTVSLTVSALPGVTDSSGDNTNARLSPDGRYLAWQSTDEAGNSDIRFTCLNPPSGVNLGPDSSAREAMPAIDNQGRIVYVYHNAQGDQLRRYDGGRNVRFAHVSARVIRFPSVSGDGKLVTFDGGTTAATLRVQLLSTETGLLSAAPDTLPPSGHAPSLSGDGKRLLLLDELEGQDRVFEFDLATRTLSPLFPDFSGRLQAPRYVGSGTGRLVVQRTADGVCEVFGAARSAREPQPLANALNDLSEPALCTP